MAIKYFEQRRERAREEAARTLQKLRDFYSENNPIYNPSSREMNLVSFRVLGKSGKEDPVKSLKRIRGSMPRRGGYSLERALPEVEAYWNMPLEKRQELREVKMRPSRIRKGLERWVEKAEPILTGILKENTEKLNGMCYDNIGSDLPEYGWSYHYQINSEEGSLRITKWTGEGPYYDNLPRPEEEVASEMLKDISYPWRYERLSERNKLRNKLVREIEKRTGRNLKREVYEARQSK